MIHAGDCVTVMAGMPADSVDAVVTDPPYGLEFMGKKWDRFWNEPKVSKPDGLVGSDGVRRAKTAPTSAHTASPNYIAGTPFQAWCEAWGREALRVTKPGGYLLAFGGTRTHHRLVCGLEDAGWIIRDELDWIYASGFPKGKANLKPAHEPIVLARKPGPLRPLAIDATRIPTDENYVEGFLGREKVMDNEIYGKGLGVANPQHPAGRWPSNLLLSDPELFDEPNPYVVGSGAVQQTHSVGDAREYDGGWAASSGSGLQKRTPYNVDLDSGGYSRFFIVPKSARADREPIVRGQLEGQIKASYSGGVSGTSPRDDNFRSKDARENLHPTVKPTDLMRHLVRLVTPSGGTVLDPFLGSGSTAIACELEGFPWIGIEKEPEYVAIAEARLNGTQRGLGLDVPAPTRKQPKQVLDKDPDRFQGTTGGSFSRPYGNQKAVTDEPAA